MIQELSSASVDHRSARGEKFPIRKIVMDESNPRVEKQGEGHGFYLARLRVGLDGGGQMEGDGRLNEDEALPRFRGQERRLHYEPCIEAFALAYPFHVRLEDFARPRARFGELMEAERYGVAEIPYSRDDEALLAAEVGEDASLRDSRFP